MALPPRQARKKSIVSSKNTDVFYFSENQKLLFVVIIHQLVDALGLVEKRTDAFVMVERIDQICHVFAHIDACVPFAGKKLRGTSF